MITSTPTETVKTKKKLTKKWWFWAIIILLAIIVLSPKDAPKKDANKTNTTPSIAATNEPTNSSAQNKPDATPATETKKAPEPSVSAEFKSALAQAGTYSSTMHMSKKGVYDQLVSEYGGKFKPEAAQYAIDNVKADWNANTR